MQGQGQGQGQEQEQVQGLPLQEEEEGSEHRDPSSPAGLTSGLGSPSTGGLEPVTSRLYSQDGVADAILITVKVHFHILAASS